MCNDNRITELIDRLTQEEKDDMLMLAIDHDKTYLVNLAIAFGANVNQGDSKYVSPIGRAVLNNSIDNVRVLIDAGANVKNNYYAVHQSTMNLNYNMAKLLIMSGAPIMYVGELFEAAAIKEDTEFLRFLYEKDVKVTEEQKRTALDNNDKKEVIDIIKLFKIKED